MGTTKLKRMSEKQGAGALGDVPREGKPPVAKAKELAKLVERFQVGLPAGYETFVTKLGEGLYGMRVRVYSPARVLRENDAWRGRIAAHWFWGKKPLSQEEALASLCIGDTLDGDELVVHPRDPDEIVLLPRESSRARVIGRGLAQALAVLVKSKAPVLRAFPAERKPAEPRPKKAAARSAGATNLRARAAIVAAVSKLAPGELRTLLDASPGVLEGAWSAELVSMAMQTVADKAKLYLSGAYSAGSLAIVEKERVVFDLLIERGADVTGEAGKTTPLMTAVDIGYPPFVAVLLERGADPNRVDSHEVDDEDDFDDEDDDGGDESPLSAVEKMLSTNLDAHGKARFEEILRLMRARTK